MNVKQGDLAFIVGGSKFAGRIVEVLSRAPIGVSFALPDGFTQCAQEYEWVIKFVGSPVDAPVGLNGQYMRSRKAFYGCAPDRKLRPINGVPVDEDVTEDMKEPSCAD
ncbi:hypothetical protein [Paraburkholderia elongata]|uniref:Uncharacterized protein n=1 Tax=Paraburkholderia elongata TaxID=2675747 RepID=A0A972NV79_9BURK|nr:hypothetical protein [Paraburkholderia elongata]NPT59063.1 hypothetical protein [Paraburkholderia elongata]